MYTNTLRRHYADLLLPAAFKANKHTYHGSKPMNRTQKGSLSIEALVMLGLIASLTPVLYKHVTDRHEDIDNINEANTLLLLKNAATEYIADKKESLTIGTTVLEPTDIGVEITGYQIGIKKEADGTINAMIAASGGGSDMKAAKVASLLGVSAGIYSAQDTSKAWGINGIWAEDISRYGLTSLPTGVPIVTTAYDKDTTAGINEEQLKDILENTTYEALTVKKLCIDNPEIPEDERCIVDWNIIGINPLEIIAACNNGDQSACTKGWEKNINRSCSDISIKYQGAGFTAPSGIYMITTSATTQVEKACYFVNGRLPTNIQLIEGTKTSDIARRYDWENNKITASCQSIISNWSSASTGFYIHVTGTNTYNSNQPCVFTGNRLATNNEVITQCNSNGGTSVQCRYGWNNNINRSCARVIASWTSAPTGWHNITTSSSATSTPCVFTGNRVATNAEVITQCNSNGGASVQCRYGWNNNINRSCERVIASNTSAASGWYQITTSSSSASQPCYFVGSRVGTAAESIAQCNTATTNDTIASNIACRYAYLKGYNTNCTDLVNNYSAGKGITNSITTATGGSRECCQCCPSGGRCATLSGKTWVLSIEGKNYWDSSTFCNNIGMTLKSRAQIKAAGLWYPPTIVPFGTVLVWTTDAYSSSRGWLVWLNNGSGAGHRYFDTILDELNINPSYALCGPK